MAAAPGVKATPTHFFPPPTKTRNVLQEVVGVEKHHVLRAIMGRAIKRKPLPEDSGTAPEVGVGAEEKVPGESGDDKEGGGWGAE